MIDRSQVRGCVEIHTPLSLKQHRHVFDITGRGPARYKRYATHYVFDGLNQDERQRLVAYLVREGLSYSVEPMEMAAVMWQLFAIVHDHDRVPPASGSDAATERDLDYFDQLMAVLRPHHEAACESCRQPPTS